MSTSVDSGLLIAHAQQMYFCVFVIAYYVKLEISIQRHPLFLAKETDRQYTAFQGLLDLQWEAF